MPNANRNTGDYVHYLHFSFYLFCHEGELAGSCLWKLQQANVLYVVNRNKHIMEPYSAIVDDVLVNLCESIRSNGDPFSQQENGEVDVN